MLNKRRRWFHSSRVKFPSVSMSASCFLVSTFLIWIFGSRLILSNNQSWATLWVLDTCLIVGLLPSMINLITASLSSKNVEHRTELSRLCVRWNMINITQFKIVVMSWNLGLVLGLLVWCCVTRRVSSYLICGFSDWLGEEWNTSIAESQRSRAGIPSMRNPASREIISASVEPCETDVCFLHIQLFGTNVWLPNMHKSPPNVDFWVF